MSVAGSNGVSTTIRVDKSKPILSDANGSAIRQNDVTPHKLQSSVSSGTSEDDRKSSSRVPDLPIQINLKPDDSKGSPTSSISSTISSQSRISTSSSASRHDVDTDEHKDVRSNIRPSRRKNVAPAFLRRLSSTQVLEGKFMGLGLQLINVTFDCLPMHHFAALELRFAIRFQ